MKKKLFCLLLILVLPVCLLFTGCGTKSENYQDNSSERFVIIEKIQDNFQDTDGNPVSFYIIVDKETKIMYFMVSGNYRFCMETMVDSDGKPLLYEGEL